MKRLTYLIVGSGFGGIGMAIRLKQETLLKKEKQSNTQANHEDFELWEKETELGGCWRDNHYPGAACDVPSHLYSFSFAPKKDWSHRFAPQSEIHAYIKDCAEKFDVLRHVRFGREISSAVFDERESVWHVTAKSGEEIRATFLITATGQLNRPIIPEIEGQQDFQGAAFHSARWDHSVDLEGKTIAVIGTGASAIQFVPEITKTAKKIKLFQRSAPYVIPKPDRKYTAFEHWLLKHVPGLYELSRLKTYCVFESRVVAIRLLKSALKLYRLKWLWFMRKQVRDEGLRRKLTPDYPMLCKRILIANNYYSTLAQSHVEVINEGVTKMTEQGIVDKQGVCHDVDVVIYGTGFSATEFLSPITVIGKEGKHLNAAWNEGAEAYLGITVNGFPNLFMLYGPNTNLGHSSIIYMLESQMQYILKASDYALAKTDTGALEVREDAQEAFNQSLQHDIQNTVWNQGCTSWYLTKEGKNTVNWPRATFTYRAMTRDIDVGDYSLL